jgi:hypothetical protein
MLIHEEIDVVVPFDHIRLLTSQASLVSKFTTRGRGHNGTLTDANVLREVLRFMRSPSVPLHGNSTLPVPAAVSA